MKPSVSLTVDNALFSSTMEDGILVIREKQHILHMTHDINAIFSFYDYLDSMLSSKAFSALAVFGHPEKDGQLEHGGFLCKALTDKLEGKTMERLANVVNRLIMTLSKLNAVTVYAGQGALSLFHLNLSLAYDCRIVAEDTVFKNPNVDLGLITKGSGYFMPRMLGVKKAAEVLQWKSFSAEEALQLGLVDKIVPAARLEEEALGMVTGSTGGPAATLLGVRKLLKCDKKALARSLELEDQLIKDRLVSPEFHKTFSAYCKEQLGCDMETLSAG